MRMLRSLILLAALALPTAVLADDTVYPPGSRIGLVPPKEMTPSKRFTGFEDARRGNALTFLEMPPEAFKELASGFKSENMKGQGFDVKTREDLKIHDRNAVLISGLQSVPGGAVRKWLLAVEDPGLTAFVVGQAMVDPTSLPDEEMRAALVTVDLRPPLTIEEQLAALPYHVPERAGVIPGYALLPDGRDSDTTLFWKNL